MRHPSSTTALSPPVVGPLPLTVIVDKVAFGSLLVAIAFTPLSESIKNVAFGVALLAGGISLLSHRPLRLIVTRVGWMHLLFLWVAVFSAFQAIDRWQGFRGVWDIFRYFAFFLLVVNLCRTESRIRWVIGAFLASATLGALLGLGGFGFNLWKSMTGRDAYWLLAVHVKSLGHPNHTATYLLMMVALALGVRLYLPLSRRLRLGLDLALGILIVALIFTFSRSAVFILLLFLLLLVGWVKQKQKKIIFTIIGAVLVSLVLGGLVGAPGNKRLGEILHPWTAPAVRDRMIVWSTLGPGFVRERPLLGAGPRNFNKIDKRRYGLDSAWDYFNHAHSLYFSVLLEMGLLGLGSLILWLGAGLVEVWRCSRHFTSYLGQALEVAYVGALIALTVSGVVTTTLHTEGAIAYSSVLGLLVAWARCRDAGTAPGDLSEEQG